MLNILFLLLAITSSSEALQGEIHTLKPNECLVFCISNPGLQSKELSVSLSSSEEVSVLTGAFKEGMTSLSGDALLKEGIYKPFILPDCRGSIWDFTKTLISSEIHTSLSKQKMYTVSSTSKGVACVVAHNNNAEEVQLKAVQEYSSMNIITAIGILLVCLQMVLS